MDQLRKLAGCMLALCWLGKVTAVDAHWWPQFRGPEGKGVAESSAPVEFGPDKNLLWRTEIATGASSPVIWQNRVFLTGYDGSKLETFCLDRKSGKVLWRKQAPAETIEPAHPTGSRASPTPVTDGNRLYVYFGSYGLLAYNFDGQEQWRVPFPQPMVEFGSSASPILADGKLILLCDQDLGSFVTALNPADGKTLWRTERPEFRRSFATPFLWRHGPEQELIVPGSIWLSSYSPADGSKRWSYEGTSRVACSTPTASDDLLFSASWNTGGDPGDRISMTSFAEFAAIHDANKDNRLTREEIPSGPIRERFTQMDLDKDGFTTPEEWELMRQMFVKAENAVLAIQPGGKGDITHSHLLWKSKRSLPYVSSPLYYNGRLYTIKNGGLASCYDARTGQAHYQDERLGALGDYYSSAIAAAGQIYIASQQGVVVVYEAGDELKVRARNKLAEQIFATPGVVDGKLYLRTTAAIYCFGE